MNLYYFLPRLAYWLVLLIAIITQCAVIAFTFAGTIVEVFRSRRAPDPGYARACLSVWGPVWCGTVKVVPNQQNKGYNCKTTASMASAAAAFGVLSILSSLCAGVILLMRGIGMLTRIVPAIAVGITDALLLITWTVLAGLYYKECDTATAKVAHKKDYTYGAGFALFVTAWVVELLLCAFIFLMS